MGLLCGCFESQAILMTWFWHDSFQVLNETHTVYGLDVCLNHLRCHQLHDCPGKIAGYNVIDAFNINREYDLK